MEKSFKNTFLFILFTILLEVAGYSQVATNVGTEFWIAFPPNSGGQTLQIFISSAVSTSGTVTSVFPGVNQTFTVTPGIVTQLTIPSGIQLSNGVVENKGIHIISLDPIAVYGLNHRPASTDAYLALPVSSLGLDYRILTYETTFSGSGTGFSVVGTQNGTVVTLYNHVTLGTTTVNLDSGQTYHVTATNLHDDLTGSRVQSNFPVSVYGSVVCVNIPFQCTACDQIGRAHV